MKPERKGQGGVRKEPSEHQRMTVLLEEVRSELRKVAEGYRVLDEKFTREFHVLRAELEQRFQTIEFALRQATRDIQQNTNGLQQNTKDLQQLQQEVRGLAERIDVHERVHAT